MTSTRASDELAEARAPVWVLAKPELSQRIAVLTSATHERESWMGSLPLVVGLRLRRWRKKAPALAEAANIAAFVASDSVSLMTGAIVNLMCGALVD